LFTYHHPQGEQTIHRKKTNDLGGIRHVAVEAGRSGRSRVHPHVCGPMTSRPPITRIMLRHP
jgi:hypothetical protein